MTSRCPTLAAAHEHAVHALDFERRVSTDELELPIRAQDSGQEARLAQDLEPVADAQHRASARCEGADGVHDRSDAGDRARAQVVAVGEASRQDDCPDCRRQLGLLVPHERRLRADGAEGPRGVSIVVRAREDDDGDVRPVRHDSSRRISKLSMSGLASSSSHMRWISARAPSASSASTSRSTTRPTRAASDVEPELLERMPNRVALRVEDAFLGSDENRRLHSTISGRATYSANATSVSRSKASM